METLAVAVEDSARARTDSKRLSVCVACPDGDRAARGRGISCRNDRLSTTCFGSVVEAVDGYLCCDSWRFARR